MMELEEGIPQPNEILSQDREICLSPMSLEDTAELFALIDSNRPHLSQFADDTAQKYPTLASLQESVTFPANPKKLRYVIRNKEGVIVGSINLTPIPGEQRSGEVGYYLGAQHQGRGYMTRAVQTLTAYAFQTLGYDVLSGTVHNENLPSARVLLKAGYQQIGKAHDFIVYRIKKGQDSKAV